MRISDWSQRVLFRSPIRKNREFTMRTSQSLSILAITTALATTGWAIPAAAQDEGASAIDDSATIIVTGTRRTDRTVADSAVPIDVIRSEEHTSELQSLMRISYAVFCLKQKN